MKKTTITISLIIILIALYLAYNSTKSSTENTLNENVSTSTISNNPYDAKYIINQEEVNLINGVSEMSIPNSSSTVITKYFGNEVKGDFDQDGNEDVAFLITQNSGGSGTFYYLLARLNKSTGAIGSYSVLIGDRIAPQSTSLGENNTIVVNYADRKPAEPFTTQPSLGKSIILKYDTKTNQFGEVVKDFEGEANPSLMKLDMKTWSWISTTYNDGKIIKPKLADKFKLTFKGKTFSAATDCNGVGGEYVLSGNKITFDKMMSTLMFCEGSQESDFSKGLTAVSSYHFTSKGELVFDLKYDSGVMVFK